MTGCRTRLAAGPLLAFAALVSAALAPQPAAAQSFLDSLFGGGTEEPAPEPEAAPASKKAGKSAKDKAAAEKPATDKATAKPSAKPAAPATAAAPPAVQSGDPASLVERANAYFNSFQTLTGSFLQTGADGRRIGGKLYLAKPGRLRFEYDQPSPLEVVADGTSVAVRDRKLDTQDLYFINQTPLKFLLRDRINLASDLTVTEVTNDPGGYRISLEDRSTLGGTSKIQLFFDNDFRTLSQWRITDPQGYLTIVQLSNLQPNRAISGVQFFIDYGRAEDKAMKAQIQRGQANAQ